MGSARHIPLRYLAHHHMRADMAHASAYRLACQHAGVAGALHAYQAAQHRVAQHARGTSDHHALRSNGTRVQKLTLSASEGLIHRN